MFPRLDIDEDVISKKKARQTCFCFLVSISA
jgi:hypothetical protein